MPVDLVGALGHKEHRLADAFARVSARHADDPGLHDACMLLAAWSRSHLQRLQPVLERYAGALTLENEAAVPALDQDRSGDLRVLAALAADARETWRALAREGEAQADTALTDACASALARVQRQLDWLAERGAVPVTPPEVTVARQAPQGPRAAVVASAASLALGGLLAWLAGVPSLLVPLGATVWLGLEAPRERHARFYNSLAGHLLALCVGSAVAFAVRAWRPALALEVVAAMGAIAITVLVARRLDASHPPAAATAALVALGSVATAQAAAAFVAGAALAATGNALVRRLSVGPVLATARREQARAPSARDRRRRRAA